MAHSSSVSEAGGAAAHDSATILTDGRRPLRGVGPRTATALAGPKRTALFASAANRSAPGPSMVTPSVMSNCPLVRLICPEAVRERITSAPGFAFAARPPVTNSRESILGL
jgi:hypothetical protein